MNPSPYNDMILRGLLAMVSVDTKGGFACRIFSPTVCMFLPSGASVFDINIADYAVERTTYCVVRHCAFEDHPLYFDDFDNVEKDNILTFHYKFSILRGKYQTPSAVQVYFERIKLSCWMCKCVRWIGKESCGYDTRTEMDRNSYNNHIRYFPPPLSLTLHPLPALLACLVCLPALFAFLPCVVAC
jgi:hypothetical protein